MHTSLACILLLSFLRNCCLHNITHPLSCCGRKKSTMAPMVSAGWWCFTDRITLYGKRDSADVIKVLPSQSAVRMEIIWADLT